MRCALWHRAVVVQRDLVTLGIHGNDQAQRRDPRAILADRPCHLVGSYEGYGAHLALDGGHDEGVRPFTLDINSLDPGNRLERVVYRLLVDIEHRGALRDLDEGARCLDLNMVGTLDLDVRCGEQR